MKQKNRREIADVMETRYGTDYVFMGRTFYSQIDDKSCQIDICGHTSNLVELFQTETTARIPAASVQQIAQHRQTVYLISTDVGYEACFGLAELVQVFLRIGGLGVWVKSTDLIHSRQKWLDNYNSLDVFDLYSLFVTLIESDNCYCSQGMENFGKANVALSLEEDEKLAIYVMNVFNYYRLTESPILLTGHTFQADVSTPKYQLSWQEDGSEQPTDGLWYLSKIPLAQKPIAPS